MKPVAKGAYKVISIEVLMSADIQGPYICTFPLHGMITIAILTWSNPCLTEEGLQNLPAPDRPSVHENPRFSRDRLFLTY